MTTVNQHKFSKLGRVGRVGLCTASLVALACVYPDGLALDISGDTAEAPFPDAVSGSEDDETDAGSMDEAGSESGPEHASSQAEAIGFTGEPESLLGFDYDCIKIDRVNGPLVVPPSGIRIGFRILDCENRPIRQLRADELRFVNDEKGEIFGEGLEGGSVSDLAPPSDYSLHSLLVLDLSDSIFLSGALDTMIDGALEYLRGVETTPLPTIQHEVGIMVFGRPDAIELVQPFTSDFSVLRSHLELLRDAESRGSTDLYGAYMHSLDVLASRPSPQPLDERFMVLFTDGTHEAGAEDMMHAEALDAKFGAEELHLFTIGVDGNYDPERISELASSDQQFVHVVDTEEIVQAFDDIARLVDGISRSNYVVGICTPLALGDEASASVEAETWGQGSGKGQRLEAGVTLPYPLDHLTGDLACCSPQDVAHVELSCADQLCEELECQTDWGSCGNGYVDAGEVCDPGDLGPLPDLECGETCEFDFSNVRQLYCHDLCSWSDQDFGCTQIDADIFCRIKTGNEESRAISWTRETALDAPGLACPFGIPGTVDLGPMPDLGLSEHVFYEPGSMLDTHGPGTVITEVECSQ